MAKDIIRVEGLTKKYDSGTLVLDDVSFSVLEGEFISIQGKSGCGKTTLLNMLGGLDRPSSGRVIIDGTDIVEMSEDELARMRLEKIGFVFQDFNLIPDLSIWENVALPLRFSGKTVAKRVDELLGKFDIVHIADETANKVSGGEAQRTSIARALANEPRIILADEPTGNLDAENTRIVLDMLRLALAEFGATVVLATHDNEIANGANRRITLNHGGVATVSPD